MLDYSPGWVRGGSQDVAEIAVNGEDKSLPVVRRVVSNVEDRNGVAVSRHLGLGEHFGQGAFFASGV